MKTLKAGADNRHKARGKERSEDELRALRDAAVAQARGHGAVARWRDPAALTQARLEIARHAAARVKE